MRKLKKLIRQPGVFFRDYLNKRYSIRNAEQRATEYDKLIVIENSLTSSIPSTIPTSA